MNQKNETDALLPGWLAEHTAIIGHSGQTDIDLSEPINDHARMIKAIMILEREMLREGGKISMHCRQHR